MCTTNRGGSQYVSDGVKGRFHNNVLKNNHFVPGGFPERTEVSWSPGHFSLIQMIPVRCSGILRSFRSGWWWWWQNGHVMMTDDVWRTKMTMVIISHPLPRRFFHVPTFRSSAFSRGARKWWVHHQAAHCTQWEWRWLVRPKTKGYPFLENVSKFQIWA